MGTNITKDGYTWTGKLRRKPPRPPRPIPVPIVPGPPVSVMGKGVQRGTAMAQKLYGVWCACEDLRARWWTDNAHAWSTGDSALAHAQARVVAWRNRVERHCYAVVSVCEVGADGLPKNCETVK